MDYQHFTLYNQINNDKLLFESLLTHMQDESQMILLYNGINVLQEADNNTTQNNQSNKIDAVWEKIKEFFNKLFGLFKEKATVLYNGSKEWIANNFKKLDSLNLSNIKIQALEYWNVGVNSVKATSSKIINKFSQVLNNDKKIKDYSNFETMKNELLKEFLDEDGDLIKGLTNMFQVGRPKNATKPVTIEGDNLKSKLQEMKDFCSKYISEVLPIVDSLKNFATNELQKIENNLKNKSVKESFCMLENTTYINLGIILEAENENQNNNVNANNNEEHKPTDVKVTTTDDKTNNNTNNNNNSQENKDQNTSSTSNIESDRIKFLNNAAKAIQLVVSSAMTALENKFKTYMAILKQLVLKAVNKVKETVTGKNKEENNSENKSFNDRVKDTWKT
jgi:hypothetical protein